MAPKRRANYRPRPVRVVQDSDFLDLPREIRDLIYAHALTSPNPIDLWPGKRLSEDAVKENPALRARLKKAEDKRNNPDLSIPARQRNQAVRIASFRQQQDLEFVRKGLSVGLLSTCTQVYDEAWRHFWCNNVWRFSHDVEWLGLRRFLTTVGPRVRKSLKHIQPCFAAENVTVSLDDAPRTDSDELKNHPKLRMAKVHCITTIENNARFISELLVSDGPNVLLTQMEYLIPSGFSCTEITKYDDSTILQWLHPSWLKHVVIAQAGSSVVDLDQGNAFMPGLLDAGFNLILEAGSKLNDALQETQTEYRPELEDLCLRDLFSEPEDGTVDTVANLGGRANKRSGIPRQLKGFGGCRFERRMIWMLKSMNWFAVDEIPEQWRSRSEDVVEVVFINVKNPKRAARQGIINDPDRHLRVWDPLS